MLLTCCAIAFLALLLSMTEAPNANATLESNKLLCNERLYAENQVSHANDYVELNARYYITNYGKTVVNQGAC
jgi:hypothetical protein